jgi:transposase
LPDAARAALLVPTEQIKNLDDQIDKVETAMVRRSRVDETARRLATVPGIGAITATALQALLPDPSGFKSGRHFDRPPPSGPCGMLAYSGQRHYG